MLVSVNLHGEMGKLFGEKWNLAARSPSHALRLINANKNGLLNWIQSKASEYKHYIVLCEFKDGTKRRLSDEDYLLNQGNLKAIHFTPVIQGAGGSVSGILQAVVGVAFIAIGAFAGQPWLAAMGGSLLLGGISQLLAPKVKTNSDSEKRTSHYFNGTEQVETQGAPIQLIYGRCLVQGAPISVSTTVDQLLTITDEE